MKKPVFEYNRNKLKQEINQAVTELELKGILGKERQKIAEEENKKYDKIIYNEKKGKTAPNRTVNVRRPFGRLGYEKPQSALRAFVIFYSTTFCQPRFCFASPYTCWQNVANLELYAQV